MPRAVVLAVVLAFAAVPAAAQMELGVMIGTVTDEAGKPLDGATIRLRDLERGRETVFKSDKSGRFYRRGLQAVEYEMVVELGGYQPVKDKVKLVAGSDRRLDFKLAKSAPEGAEEFAAGIAAFNKGDNAGAATAFEAALAKAPGLPEIHVNLGLAYLRLGRHADAVAQLEQATALGLGAANVLFQLGAAYVEMQTLDQAAAAFEAGLAKQPDLSDPLAYEAAVTLGSVYFARGQNDQASARFEQALAARPGAAVPALGLAKVQFSKGEVEKALALFDRVVAQHPGTPEAAQAAAFIKELRKGQGAVAPDSASRLAVLSAGAVEEAVLRLVSQYGRDAGGAPSPQFGTAPEIEKRLAAGEAADVFIAPAAVLERAVKAGAIVAGTAVPAARVGVGVTVRRGVAAPDVSTVDALKAALLGADSVVYNQASTGQYLETLFARMGILERLKPRTTRYANAAQVLEHVIAGQGNEIGFGPVTEIKSFEAKGVVLVAALPEEIQNYTTYLAALTTRARAADASRDFIRFLTSASARQVFLSTGAR